VLKNLSGRELKDADTKASFFDLGFDSLLLTQASQSLRGKFGVKISFRQLLEDLVSIDAVTTYLDEKVPADKWTAPAVAPASAVHAAAPVVAAMPAPIPKPVPVRDLPVTISTPAQAVAESNGHTNGAPSSAMDRIVKQQLALMTRQLELLNAGGISTQAETNGHAPASEVVATVGEPQPTVPAPEPEKKTPAAEAPPLTPKYFGPFKPIDKSPGGGLTERQQKHLDSLISAYVAKTPRSKAYTQKHRPHFADPRTVSGFRQTWKEMVYPISVNRSSGTRMWDIDGNEFLDVTMGFGTNLFGHSPEFVTRAVQWQLRKGMEVGPQSPIAGKAAALMCELTGMERAAFCNTGSEAVLAAVRLARTVTGRTKIATFSGYHGINDEVLVRATVVDGVRKPMPIAPGIPEHIVSEVLVLDYGTPESLELLRAHAHELAAVLVEPVQSRQPDLQPRQFLHEVRKITAESETALIFDELITGFRAHPGGAQAWFGVQADLATYGKIIGGGVPIGALCGKAMYMDALDGGQWQYGDASFPEVGVTFFAGTYVRHPLAIRAALSVLTRLKREGPALQDRLAERTEYLAKELNGYFEAEQIPMRVVWFRSLFYFVYQQEFKYSSLLYYHLRLKGLHIWEGRLGFVSTAHTDDDLAFIIRVFKESLAELREGGFLPEAEQTKPPEIAPVTVATRTPHISTRPLEFSLYYFGNYDAAYREDKYQLVIDGAKFADQHGFTAIWLPERHFHAVGGFSPNSSVLAAALARETTQLQLRGGSVVLPLHHPVRVAEEWSVVDNLSNGRVGISIATGWHPNDFVFAPDAYKDRRNISLQNLDVIQRLWRGETVDLPTAGAARMEAKLFPAPKQKDLPVWLTCIHQDSYAQAGKLGLNVLGYLMNQTVEELAEKIAIYREARRAAGHDPATGHVTTLLFTYLDETVEKAQDIARGPLCHYLRSYLDNSQKRIETTTGENAQVDEEDIAYLTNRSCNEYFNGKSLVGTPASVAPVVARLRALGVDEIGCFIDFGVDSAHVLKSLAAVEHLKALTASPTAAKQEDVTVPLPEAEKGLWLLSDLNADANRAYHESATLSFKGKLDVTALRESIAEIVARHGALRTTINANGESQTIHAQSVPEIELFDFSALSIGEREAAALQKMTELENALFPELRGPFFRASLLKLGEEMHFLVLTFHHLLGNGPSYWLFKEELAALYEARVTKTSATLPPAVPFAEFIGERMNYGATEAGQEAETFWMKQFEAGVPELDLPFDHARPAELTYLGARQELILDAELNAALRKVGAAHKSSLFMVLYAAYGALLHRLSNQDDLVIGVPFDSNIRAENDGRALFANTTNMLPLRSILYDGSTFAEYLQQTKSLILEASEHQDYFFGNLMRKLNLARDPSRPLFFNVTFNLETGEFRRKWPELEMALETEAVPYRSPRGTAMFDLYLNAAERKNGEIVVQCDHNTALVEAETMQRWLGHYRTLLQGIVAHPDGPVATLPLLTAGELAELVVTGQPAQTS
jgi:natural product biosynthesis luciferase-like monooxygenase protein